MRRDLRPQEIHPPSIGYRLVRRLRSLRRIRGWERCASILASPNKNAPFLIQNDGIAFEGNISSFIDRHIYLFGHYEEDAIKLFLSNVPSCKRSVILDVGANIGTHALAFAQSFCHVHSFEPNPALWSAFRTNIALNSQKNITLHTIGLADISADQTFYSINKNNFGLGTFSPIEQYDLPLKAIGTFRVEKADDYLLHSKIDAIDAIKIDVQGYEAEVLRGLQNTLRQFRPTVWFEYSEGTKTQLRNAEEVKQLFPYEITLSALMRRATLIWNSVQLAPVAHADLPIGDYIAVPSNQQ
jgi:FkbM family methyltransferase